MSPVTIGRYRIVDELGRGGMGIVYRAHDPELDRTVAIKLIQLPEDASPDLRDELEKRFRREAKAAARIRHPGVVAIHDVGVIANGLYLVMELVDGDSLATRLQSGAFPDRATALELGARAADALSAAHAAGVVHRDVKPANILLSRDGRVLLTDFGVARSLDEVSELTRTGMVVGSPAYMAPEQLQGAAVDGRADLFSLGVVLYELLLHKRPFPAQSITTLLYQILHEDPLADPALARELDGATAAVLRGLLAKAPAERFADAATVSAALRGLPPLAPAAEDALTWPRLAASAAPAYRPPERRSPALLWVGTAVAALIVAVGLLAWWNAAPRRPLVLRPPAPAWSPASAPLPEASVSAATPTPLPLAAAPTPAAPPLPQPPRVAVKPTPAPLPPQPTPTLAVEAAREEVPPPRPPHEIAPALRLRCRRGIDFKVEPEAAQVSIDGLAIGNAKSVDSYAFSEPGRHFVRLSYPGYRSAVVEVTVAPDADSRNVNLELKLEKSE